MTTESSKENSSNSAVVSRSLIKKSGIKVKKESNGRFKFDIPEKVQDDIKRHYNFNVDMLSVGGELSSADLAVHLDEQATIECHVSTLAEYSRYELKEAQDEYEVWYERMFYKVKQNLIKREVKNLTDKTVVSRLSARYGDEMLKRKRNINELEFKHRLLANVIRSSVVTKGMMLPSLKNIIHGSHGDGIGPVVKSEKLRMSLDVSNMKRKKTIIK